MKHFKLLKSFLLAIIAAMLPQLASAYDFMVDSLCYNYNDDGTSVTVTSGGSYTGDVIVPSEVSYNGATYSVTTIGQDAFRRTGLTSVTIPNSVTEIGDRAFEYCRKLRMIHCGIIEPVTIGSRTFMGCYGAILYVPQGSVELYKAATYWNNFKCIVEEGTSILPPGTTFETEGVKYVVNIDSISLNVIANDYSGDIVIPEFASFNGVPFPVTSIGDDAFRDCIGLTSVTIGNLVKTIGEDAFYYCTGLTSVTIGNSVTSIGEYAFYGCNGITQVNINDLAAWCNIDFGDWSANPLTYARNLYVNDNLLTNLDIPNTVTAIKKYSFEDCQSLTQITIPNSVTSIGDEAFIYCTGLTSVTIPNSVTSIGDEAFYCCYGLTSIIVEEGNTKYDSRNNCNALIQTEGDSLITGCNNTIIPNSVTSIGKEAFLYCTGLTSVTIPKSVTSIGEAAFFGCNGLTSIIVEEGNTKYDSRNNCNAIIETEADSLITGCRNTIIPNSVISIGREAFAHCPDLISVTFPSSVTSIGDYAFAYCPDLTSVTIPNSVTSVSGTSFNQCRELASIVVASDNTKYDSRNNCNAIIETSSNKLILGCKTTTIPNSVTSIGDLALFGCTGLTSITIPNSVTEFGWEPFGCTGLTSVVIPNSIVTLNTMAFDRCNNLETISLPNSLSTFSTLAFYGCSNIKTIISHIQDPSSVFYERYYMNGHVYVMFEEVDKGNCTLYVPKGTIEAYQNHEQWSGFVNIVELEYGDVNGDGVVTAADITELYNYLLNGSTTYLSTSDITGDGVVTAADITAVYNIMLEQ